MSTATMDPKQETAAGYELSITRTFDAPRELVWKAWTDAGMARHWMGPRGFKAIEFVSPSEAGGEWWMQMEGNIPGTGQAVTLRQGGVVKEMRPPELLIYTFAWSDPTTVGLTDKDIQETLVTVRFEEKGNKTEMKFTQSPFLSAGARDGHNGGWNSAFDKFAEFLLAQQPPRTPNPEEVPSELHLRRVFKAPRQVVFDAWTNPEILAQWWGPKNFTNPVCNFEARAGGEIYVEMRSPDGVIYPMSGKIMNFCPPYQFDFTTSALDKNGNALFQTRNSVFFTEVDGGTEVILDVSVMNQTDEAPQYLKGMREGWSMSLDKLADLLQTKTN